MDKKVKPVDLFKYAARETETERRAIARYRWRIRWDRLGRIGFLLVCGAIAYGFLFAVALGLHTVIEWIKTNLD